MIPARTAVRALLAAGLCLSGLADAETLARPRLARVIVEATLRVEPDAGATGVGELQRGATVSIVGQAEEILASADGDRESAGEWFRVEAHDGGEGWVEADALWPELPGWPEAMYLLSDLRPATDGRSGLYVLEAQQGDRRSRMPEDLAGVADLLFRRGERVVVEHGDSEPPDWLFPNGLAFDDRCRPPGIFLPAERPARRHQAEQRPSLALLLRQQQSAPKLPPKPLATAGAPSSSPELELVEVWLRPRLEGLGLPAWSSAVTNCEWTGLDPDDARRARVLGVCTVSVGEVSFSVLLVARHSHGIFEPRLVRLAPATIAGDVTSGRYGGRIASPKSLVLTDLDGDGRRELWLQGWSSASRGGSFWLLFFDLGGEYLGPFSFSLRACPDEIARSAGP